MGAEQTVAYRVLNLEPYIQHGGMFANGQPTLIVASGRGCAKGCGFCYWREHEPGLLKADAIVELLEFLRDRYGVRQFHLAELDFFASKGRVISLAQLFKERLPDCTWFSLGSPCDAIKLSEADWDLLAESGCRKLEIGAESGSPRVLAALGKTHEADAPYVLARRMLARGIVARVNFIFGLPDESPEDVAASLDLITRLHALDPDRVVMTYRFYVPTWETPLGEKAFAKFPKVPRDVFEMVAWRERTGQEAFMELEWLPEQHRTLVRGLVRYFLPILTNKPHIPAGFDTLVYRSLRVLAKLRFRFGVFGAAFEPSLFRRLYGPALEQTCFP
jgi:radical SAM superfamily enzyme YgiQ (UPF0313 family)